jgi:hypothetical protein
MPAPPSRLVIGTPEASHRAPGLLIAFGDRDDPQRLAVLLAEHVAEQLPADRAVRGWVDICLAPKASWKERRLALSDALSRAAERGAGHLVTLVDVDALAPPSGGDSYGDQSVAMRKDLYRVVLEGIARGGWVVVRPCPCPEITADLADLGIVEEYAPEPAGVAYPEEANPFAPEIRPLAAGLVRRGMLHPRDLSRLVTDVTSFDEHLVSLACDALPAEARSAGELLSALRPPQRANGALGPFAYADGLPSATAVPRAAVQVLAAAGFLQPGAEPSTLRMPRLVRDLLRRHAAIEAAGEVRRLHARLAAEGGEGDTPAQLEAHHHAALAGDVERAKRTARFYGTELRDLATRMSLEANQAGDRAKFAQAAELFDYIVKNFDEADAYSWEYLGYNLARADAAANAPRVLKAYERAHQLSPTNPLYHGRLLGFRGQMGQDVRAEFVQWLDRYVAKSGPEAVSFFARAALKGLRHGGRREQVAHILRQRRELLERFAPRSLDEGGARPAPVEEGGQAGNAHARPHETRPREQLTALHEDLEARSLAWQSAAPADRPALRREIDRLRAKAATMIKAKADAALGPVEQAHANAAVEARRLLGR